MPAASSKISVIYKRTILGLKNLVTLSHRKLNKKQVKKLDAAQDWILFID